MRGFSGKLKTTNDEISIICVNLEPGKCGEGDYARTLASELVALGRDILDQLILEYNRNSIENKNLTGGNTAYFIHERLKIINGKLDSV